METNNWTKSTFEQIDVAASAENLIATGDTIASVTFSIEDEAGTDVGDSMLEGSASISGTTVTQTVKAGTDGNNYLLTIQITTAAGEKFEDTILVRVRDDVTYVESDQTLTLEEVKTVLRINNSDHDDFIRGMIKPIKEWTREFCRSKFLMKKCSITEHTIAFVNGSPPTITDSAELFLSDAYFTSGIDIEVTGSKNNDGLYLVTTAAAATLTLDQTEDLIAEVAGNDVITITRVNFPKSVRTAMSAVIGYYLRELDHDQGNRRVAVERIGDYSANYGITMGGQMPKDIVALFPRRIGLK